MVKRSSVVRAVACPHGVQLRRIKDWTMPAHTRSVARPTRWGNVYVVGEGAVAWSGSIDGPCAGYYDPTDARSVDQAVVRASPGLSGTEAVFLYERDLSTALADLDEHYDELRAALEELRGWNLACWCPLDAPCHRNVVLRLANQ